MAGLPAEAEERQNVVLDEKAGGEITWPLNLRNLPSLFRESIDATVSRFAAAHVMLPNYIVFQLFSDAIC